MVDPRRRRWTGVRKELEQRGRRQREPEILLQTLAHLALPVHWAGTRPPEPPS